MTLERRAGARALFLGRPDDLVTPSHHCRDRWKLDIGDGWEGWVRSNLCVFLLCVFSHGTSRRPGTLQYFTYTNILIHTLHSLNDPAWVVHSWRVRSKHSESTALSLLPLCLLPRYFSAAWCITIFYLYEHRHILHTLPEWLCLSSPFLACPIKAFWKHCSESTTSASSPSALILVGMV